MLLMKRTTIYLEDELHKKLKVLAAEENRSMGNMITEALALTVFLSEAGQHASPKAKVKGKQMAELFKASLTKKRGEINSEDYF